MHVFLSNWSAISVLVVCFPLDTIPTHTHTHTHWLFLLSVSLVISWCHATTSTTLAFFFHLNLFLVLGYAFLCAPWCRIMYVSECMIWFLDVILIISFAKPFLYTKITQHLNIILFFFRSNWDAVLVDSLVLIGSTVFRYIRREICWQAKLDISCE